MSYPFDCITDFIFVETEISPADVILVPGADHPELMKKAADLFKNDMAPYILPSGGYKPHVGTTEWEYLRKVGMENGVPPEFILKEDEAQHTLENARYSLDVLKSNGIPHGKVIIVCKACHSRRALMCYQEAFPRNTKFMVSPVVGRFGITKENWFTTEVGIRRTMTEVEKIGQYFGDFIPEWVER
ncbi:YdcF family protein [Halobacillus locisalis]|uniref:YdcF family protein n=1 Tax=Halobacillus locisalis TaxID=220753 RepID=A0A838CZ27_9BACI|nr:YdcF family protein [Halobacillus locisalis]MBA2177023.1 YdcF family protein [Halobacillus locisalis]